MKSKDQRWSLDLFIGVYNQSVVLADLSYKKAIVISCGPTFWESLNCYGGPFSTNNSRTTSNKFPRSLQGHRVLHGGEGDGTAEYLKMGHTVSPFPPATTSSLGKRNLIVGVLKGTNESSAARIGNQDICYGSHWFLPKD